MAAATPMSPRPVYNAPSSTGNPRPRVNSARKTSYSTPLPPSLESPRTLLARDTDTFSYNAKFLPNWYMDQGLWERLPAPLKDVITHLQHAGAAVLTGFERLEQHNKSIDIGPKSEVEDEMMVQLDESLMSSLSSLSPRLDTESTDSSFAIVSYPSSGSQSPSTSASQHSLNSPISPVTLAADAFPDMSASFLSSRSRERSFSTPLEPHNAYYVHELSQLRTESIPRLRHAARGVDVQLAETMRDGTMNAFDSKQFQGWWAEKKCKVLDIDEKGRRLSDVIGLASNGVGWTAP